MRAQRSCGKLVESSIDIYSIIYTLAFIVIFQPRVLDNIGLIEGFREGLQLVVSLTFFISLVLHNELSFSKMEISLLCFVLWGLVLTLIYSPERAYLFFASTGFKVFAVLVWFKSVIHHKCPKLIRCIVVYFSVMIWINAALMLLFPSGLLYSSIGAIRARANWLFGSKNQVTVFALLALMFLRLLFISSRKKFWLSATIILLLAEAFSTGSDRVELFGGSTTAIIVLSVYFFLCFILYVDSIKWLRKVIKVKYFVLFSLAAVLFVWYFSMHPEGFIAERLESFFSLFGKDLTFSNRGSIWASVYGLILKRPVFGYGYAQFFFRNNDVSFSSYSFWGSMMLYYGLVGVMLLIVAFFLCDRSVGIAKRASEKFVMPIRLCLLMILLVGTVNEVNWQYIVLLLELCNHQEYISRLI